MYIETQLNEMRIVICYHAFHEFIGSLHVLSNPKHHLQRQKWATKKSAELPETLLGELAYFNEITDDFMGMIGFIHEENTWNMSISEILGIMVQMPLAQFLHISSNEKGIGDRDGEAYRQRLICFLRNYYTYFASDLSFAEPLLIRNLQLQRERLVQLGIDGYLASLHPRIECKEEMIRLHKYKLFEFNKKTVQSIIIHLDTYFTPHLLFGEDQHGTVLSFIAPIIISSQMVNAVPIDTMTLYKCLGDKTRLLIIKNLYQKARSTQELAIQLNISEAAVSKQLKMLEKSMIVLKQRSGLYMLYSLNVQILDSMVLYLHEYITG